MKKFAFCWILVVLFTSAFALPVQAAPHKTFDELRLQLEAFGQIEEEEIDGLFDWIQEVIANFSNTNEGVASLARLGELCRDMADQQEYADSALVFSAAAVVLAGHLMDLAFGSPHSEEQEERMWEVWFNYRDELICRQKQVPKGVATDLTLRIFSGQ